MPQPPHILLTGGGSGGHIIPNLAVATAIKKENPKAKLTYIGSRRKMDAQLVQEIDIPFYGIFAGKLRRYFAWQNFIDPFLVIIGFLQSLAILTRLKPDVVFSKGGYVSLPVVFAAFIIRIPVILHESDSRMGLANRLASRMSKKVCVAFPGLVKTGRYILTGNPIRFTIACGKPEEGYKITNFNPNHPVVLVWGGSQGAQQINEMVEKEFYHLKHHFQIIHITGKGKKIEIEDPAYRAFEYLSDNLKHIYAITDFVVGRAGANSLYELAAMEKPNVLIPLQNADQQGNARYFAKMGASIIWQPGHTLYELLTALWENKQKRANMKESLYKIARPHAAEEIAKLILGS